MGNKERSNTNKENTQCFVEQTQKPFLLINGENYILAFPTMYQSLTKNQKKNQESLWKDCTIPTHPT